MTAAEIPDPRTTEIRLLFDDLQELFQQNDIEILGDINELPSGGVIVGSIEGLEPNARLIISNGVGQMSEDSPMVPNFMFMLKIAEGNLMFVVEELDARYLAKGIPEVDLEAIMAARAVVGKFVPDKAATEILRQQYDARWHDRN